jgi:hypothetical protein
MFNLFWQDKNARSDCFPYRQQENESVMAAVKEMIAKRHGFTGSGK